MALPAFCRPCRWAAWSRGPTHRGVPITGCNLSGSPVPIAPRSRCPAARGLADRDAPPTGLSRFEELSRREAAQTVILYAIDLIEHDGEDLRDRPFLERKAALARRLRDAKAGILLNEHIVEDGLTVFAHACRLGAEGIVSKKVDGAHQSAPASSTTPIHSAGERSTRYARSDRCAIPTLPLVNGRSPSAGAERREGKFRARLLDEQGILSGLVILKQLYLYRHPIYRGAPSFVGLEINPLRSVRAPKDSRSAERPAAVSPLRR
jgi:hypothetical protein